LDSSEEKRCGILDENLLLLLSEVVLYIDAMKSIQGQGDRNEKAVLAIL
jgi:hypothetical protein